MSLKVLNLLAVASAGASPASFTFGLCHGNGDIATGYVANANRSGGTDYLPVWKDYVQPSYYLTVRQVRPTGPIGWYDFADVYKSWARQQLWAQVPRLGRDTFGFYKNTGLVVGFPGSVFAVSHPDPGPYDPREDFILAFHNILRRDADHPSRVLFVTGWDWHPPFVTVQRPGGAQWGDRQEYWLARYGVSGSGYRSNYDRIKGLGDFVLPYLFEFRMDIDFDGWTQPDPGVAGGRGAAKADPNAPWFDKVIVPQEGGVQLRPRGLCPATPAFAQYFADREDYIRHAVIDGDPSTILTLDGAYHDVGAGIGGFACYGCGIGAGHSHNIGYQIGFKIGMGGFLFGAVREILTANLYGPGVTRPIFGQKRRELYGTEAIHELLIDVVDLYGTVPSWGPYKDALTDEHGAYTPPPPPSPTSPNQAMWLTYWMLKERICVEEPMLQYVYGPVMAVKAHNATVSGAVPYGTHPTNDIGDAFYWLAAQAYLNGMVLNLQYDNTPLDVLANPANPNDPNSMDPKTPTYMLGWLRETLQQALRPESVGPEVGEDPDPLAPEGTLMPLAGKHPIAGGDSRFLRFRTYGDPKKLQYVRMLAYVRSHVLSEFLVHGEMMRPGTAATAQEPVALAYNYYWSMSHHAGNHSGEWRPASDLVSRAWREAVGEFPRVLYLVANVGREARGCSFAADLDLYGSHAARGHELQLSPGDEGSWRDWRAIAEPLAPVNGRIRVRRQVLLAPGQVWVLRLSIQTGDGEGR
jgi:hypothetical protein